MDKHRLAESAKHQLLLVYFLMSFKTPKGDGIFKEKLTGGLKNDIKIFLINFHKSSRKSETLHLDGLVLSKNAKIQMEKYRRVMPLDTEE